MSAPINATEVAMTLAKLARELDQTVKALEQADRDATGKRGVYDLAYSKAFLNAEGSVDTRKHLALVQNHQLREEADLADALVRHLRRKIDALKTRVDVGRSFGAAVRAEIALAGRDGTP